jgi:hypothetical protein
MVTAEQLRKLYYAEPFVPFVLLLDDGRRIRITEPGSIAIADETRKVAFPLPGGLIDYRGFDRVSIETASRPQRRRRKAS